MSRIIIFSDDSSSFIVMLLSETDGGSSPGVITTVTVSNIITSPIVEVTIKLSDLFSLGLGM